MGSARASARADGARRGGSSQFAYGNKKARSEKPATAVIAVVALGLLLKVKIGEPWLVLGAGAVGVALRLVLHVG